MTLVYAVSDENIFCHSLIFEKNAKFPDFSLTGKMPSNFPWFPEVVWTLHFTKQL